MVPVLLLLQQADLLHDVVSSFYELAKPRPRIRKSATYRPMSRSWKLKLDTALFMHQRRRVFLQFFFFFFAVYFLPVSRDKTEICNPKKMKRDSTSSQNLKNFRIHKPDKIVYNSLNFRASVANTTCQGHCFQSSKRESAGVQEIRLVYYYKQYCSMIAR